MAFSKFPPSQRERHVLLIEDDAAEWEVLGNALKYFGLRHLAVVESAAKAHKILQDGMEAVGGLPYDLVIADINATETGGVELTRVIRHTDGLEKLPLIVLISTATVEIVQELSQLGVSALLLKPVSPTEIAEKVSDVFAENPPQSRGLLAG